MYGPLPSREQRDEFIARMPEIRAKWNHLLGPVPDDKKNVVAMLLENQQKHMEKQEK